MKQQNTELNEQNIQPETTIEALLKEHINKLINVSKELKHTSDNAQTPTKQKYYENKLKKNNRELLKYVLGLNKVRTKNKI